MWNPVAKPGSGKRQNPQILIRPAGTPQRAAALFSREERERVERLVAGIDREVQVRSAGRLAASRAANRAEHRPGLHVLPGLHGHVLVQIGIMRRKAVVVAHDHRRAETLVIIDRHDRAVHRAVDVLPQLGLQIDALMQPPVPRCLVIAQAIGRKGVQRLALDRLEPLLRLRLRGLRLRGGQRRAQDGRHTCAVGRRRFAERRVDGRLGLQLGAILRQQEITGHANDRRAEQQDDVIALLPQEALEAAGFLFMIHQKTLHSAAGRRGMRRALRRYREYSLFLEKYSVGEKTAENNNGLNPKKPLSFGKTGCRGGAAEMPLTAALPRLRTRRGNIEIRENGHMPTTLPIYSLETVWSEIEITY